MRVPTVATVVATLAGTLALLAAPASADSHPTRTTPGAYCVANLDNGKSACADSAQEARRLADIDALAVIGAWLYDPTGFGGSPFEVYVPRPCTDRYEHEYAVPDLRPLGWNDRVSSVRTDNGCDVKLYDAVGPPADPDLTAGS